MTVLKVIGGICAVIGGLFLFVTPIVLVVAFAEHRRSRRLKLAPVVSCGELNQAGKLPRRVLVRGVLRSGAGGPVIAPLTGEPCAWYQLEIREDPVSEEDPLNITTRASSTVYLDDGTGWVALSDDMLGTFFWDTELRRGAAHGHYGTAHADGEELRPALARLRAVCPAPFGPNTSLDGISVRELHYRDGTAVTVLARPRRSAGGVLLAAGRGDGSSFRDIKELRREATGERGEYLGFAGGAFAGGLVLYLIGWGLMSLARIFEA